MTAPSARAPTSTFRLRVLIRRFHPVVGGMERQCAALCARLAAGGADVEVWTRRLPSDRPDAPAREVRDGYTVRRLRPGGVGRWGEYGGWPAMVVRLAVDRHRHDVVAVFGSGWLAVAAGLACRWTRRPWLFRPATAGDVTRFLDPASGPVGGRIGRAIARLSPLSAAWRLRVLREAGAVVAVSDEIARELAAWGFDPARIVAIPNGVDTARFRPVDAAGRAAARASLGLAGDADVGGGQSTALVLFMGRLVARKGLLDLVMAWRSMATASRGELAADVADHRADCPPVARLVIAGSGAGQHDSVEAVLRAEIDRPDAGPDVASGPTRHPIHLVGPVHIVGPVDDPAPWLAAADVFVLPSQAEGLSNALLEAMAGGLAIVASDIPPNRQALGDDAGWYHRPGDAADLARALAAALGNDEDRARRGAAARRRAEALFSLDAAAGRYVDIIARLVGTRSDRANHAVVDG